MRATKIFNYRNIFNCLTVANYSFACRPYFTMRIEWLNKVNHNHPSIFNAALNASCGISTFPNCRIFFFPAFCFSSNFFFRVASPP